MASSRLSGPSWHRTSCRATSATSRGAAWSMKPSSRRATRDALCDHFVFSLPEGEQMLGYPVAGRGEAMAPGHRRFNFVWYRPAAAGALRRAAHRHRRRVPSALDPAAQDPAGGDERAARGCAPAAGTAVRRGGRADGAALHPGHPGSGDAPHGAGAAHGHPGRRGLRRPAACRHGGDQGRGRRAGAGHALDGKPTTWAARSPGSRPSASLTAPP